MQVIPAKTVKLPKLKVSDCCLDQGVLWPLVLYNSTLWVFGCDRVCIYTVCAIYSAIYKPRRCSIPLRLHQFQACSEFISLAHSLVMMGYLLVTTVTVYTVERLRDCSEVLLQKRWKTPANLVACYWQNHLQKTISTTKLSKLKFFMKQIGLVVVLFG